MGLYKNLLVFDSADLANSDQVGANLLAGGVALTATSGALDVNITNAGVAVSATDLDIRDLLYTQDSITAYQGGTWDVNLTDDAIADDEPDSGNPFKVGSRAVSGLLTAVSASNDRADLLSDLYRRVWVNDSPNVGAQLSKPTISDTASEIAATPLGGRRRILVQNLSNKPIYVGTSSGVTVATGIEIQRRAAIELPWGEDLDIFAISESGITSDVRVLEVA